MKIRLTGFGGTPVQWRDHRWQRHHNLPIWGQSLPQTSAVWLQFSHYRRGRSAGAVEIMIRSETERKSRCGSFWWWWISARVISFTEASLTEREKKEKTPRAHTEWALAVATQLDSGSYLFPWLKWVKGYRPPASSAVWSPPPPRFPSPPFLFPFHILILSSTKRRISGAPLHSRLQTPASS